MKKQRKSKHIPTTNNPSDYNRLFFRLFSLQASRLDKLGRYHKRRLKKTLKLMKAEHFAGTLYLSGFPCSTCSHQRFEFRCPRFPSCKHKKKKCSAFDYAAASVLSFCPSDRLNRQRSEQAWGWLTLLGRLWWASTWVTTGICSQTLSQTKKRHTDGTSLHSPASHRSGVYFWWVSEVLSVSGSCVCSSIKTNK